MSQTVFKDVEALERFREKAVAEAQSHRARVLICMTGCRSMGAMELAQAFREKVTAAGLGDEVEIVDVGCHGQCVLAPAVVIEPQDYLYGGVTPDDVDEIIETTLRQGNPVERLCQKVGGKPAAKLEETPFYAGQKRSVLANCGRIDPTRIKETIARGGYATIAMALTSRQPQDIVDEVKQAGLRGRGGAGFSTGLKWELARKAKGNEKITNIKKLANNLINLSTGCVRKFDAEEHI